MPALKPRVTCCTLKKKHLFWYPPCFATFVKLFPNLRLQIKWTKTFKSIISVLFLGWYTHRCITDNPLPTRPQKITTSTYILLFNLAGWEHVGLGQVWNLALAHDLHRQLVQCHDPHHPLMGWSLHHPKGQFFELLHSLRKQVLGMKKMHSLKVWYCFPHTYECICTKKLKYLVKGMKSYIFYT